MAKDIGPVQLLAIGFDANARFEGRIMDELESLERHETIRILDRSGSHVGPFWRVLIRAPADLT